MESNKLFSNEEIVRQLEVLIGGRVHIVIDEEEKAKIRKHCRKVLDALSQFENDVNPYIIERMRSEGWEDEEIDSALAIAAHLAKPSLRHDFELVRAYLRDTSLKESPSEHGKVWGFIIQELSTNLSGLDSQTQFAEIFLSLSYILGDFDLAFDVGYVLAKIINQNVCTLMYT